MRPAARCVIIGAANLAAAFGALALVAKGGQDFTALIELIEGWTGTEVRSRP